MAPNLHETTFAAGTADALSALEADGAVIVHNFIEPTVLRTFRDDMATAAHAHHFGSTSPLGDVQHFWGAQTMRFTRLALRSAAFFDILTNPNFLALADAILLPNCSSYWMNTGQMMILAPGQQAQIMHRDADNWPNMNTPTGFEVTLSCMFAIEDFTAENGATRVVPGSHRWDDYARRATPAEVTQALMPAGSGMLYTGRALHSGGANITTDTMRWGLHVSFVLGWLVPEEALPLSAPCECVRNQPEYVQQLLGWRCSTAPDAARLWTVDYEDIPEALGLTPPFW